MRLRNRLIQANRSTKQIIVAGTDFFFFLVSLWITLSVSLTILFIPTLEEALSLFIFPVFGVLIFYFSLILLMLFFHDAVWRLFKNCFLTMYVEPCHLLVKTFSMLSSFSQDIMIN